MKIKQITESEIKNIKRQVDRDKKKLEDIKLIGDKLSKHGYRQKGYLEGRITIREDILDLLLD